MWSYNLTDYDSDIVRFIGRLELEHEEEQSSERIEAIKSLLKETGVFEDDIEFDYKKDSAVDNGGDTLDTKYYVSAIYFEASDVLFNPGVWSKVLSEFDKYIWIPSSHHLEITPYNYIEFVGDEYEHWRFVRKPDGWYDQTGEIHYDSGIKIEVGG